jgi:hypothetical protein
MIEFFKHAIGLCGEPHPSLITFLMGTPIATYLIYKFKNVNNFFEKNKKAWYESQKD